MVVVALLPQNLNFCRNPSSSPSFLATNLSSAVLICKRRDIGAKIRNNGSSWSSNSHGEKALSRRISIALPSRIWWAKLDNCFNLLVSGIITVSTLFTLSRVADAVSDQANSSTYQCEDAGSYYHDVDGLKGAALMKKLNSIVSPHRSLPYKEVWDALKILDAADIDNPESSSQVSSFSVNSSRGSKFYGECVAKSTHCLRPANNEASPDTETDKERWAPPLQARGDIARSLMYMAVSYGFHQPDGNSHLQLSDSPSMGRNEMGLLSALLQWNELDPPSRAERLRNERICRLYQHNRNPFIDHPEYANLIWKHGTPISPTVRNTLPKAWINEFHYNNKGKDQNEFIEIVVGPSTDAASLKLILYNGSNGRMYRSLSLSDKEAFSVSNSGSGFLICTAFIPIQNGPADGIALLSGRDGKQFEVLQFLSYGGIVRAADGPARGIESMDIMVQETEASSEHDSLGLTGQELGEYKWFKFSGDATPGEPNIGQRL
ncbi:hypothetical protein COCNU_02G018770 [Cocos nucifera]|uniref:Uncharacterized protein n=1 Tax=Cocos nucifera TaxID=13894 RepID=A0A8K0MYA6_COCNU|nr:hypothetical protein COCNU_02G018770 [Cocos nucifera]